MGCSFINNKLYVLLTQYLITFFNLRVINRRAFRDELELLQKIRHPNVVQFLGAVTQSSPMMIVTEYLSKVYLSLINNRGHLFPT